MVTACSVRNPKPHVMQFLLWTSHSLVLCSEPENWPLTSLLKLSSNWPHMILHIVRGLMKMHAEQSSHSLSSEPYICGFMFSGRCGDEDGASDDITASCSRSGGVSIWTWRKKVSIVSQLEHQTLWWVYLFGATHLMNQSLPSDDVSSCFRGVVSCLVGVILSGAEAEAVDLAGTRPHRDLWPLHGLPVLLVAPAFHIPTNQTDAGGSAAGDRTPPALISSILQSHVINTRVISDRPGTNLAYLKDWRHRETVSLATDSTCRSRAGKRHKAGSPSWRCRWTLTISWWTFTLWCPFQAQVCFCL